MKLSVIITTYNQKEYTDELLMCLDKQINPDVEVIVIDDGSKNPYKTPYSWCKVFRQKNKGAGSARNKGLMKSTGQYISFIDGDDIVAEDYIDRIMQMIAADDLDFIDLSWKSLDNLGTQFNYKLKTEDDRLSNCSVCTRVFNRSLIENIRFSEQKDACEDEDFSRRVGYLDTERNFKHKAITDYMYFYRTCSESSNTKRYKQGLTKTKRIVYYFNHVTKNMTDLVEEIKKEDKQNEVWLLTNQNDIPELKRYCQVAKPFKLWAHYLRGEPYSGCQIVEQPYISQIIVFIRNLNVVGGIETFIYNFAKAMKDDYDITLVVKNICPEQFAKISSQIQVAKYEEGKLYSCKTLIMLRILDDIPENITFEKSIQMCHATKTNPLWHISQNADHIVNVSKVSKDSFGKEAENGIVIHNFADLEQKKALFLVSATRIPAPDKGQNEKRMMTLANMLNDANIPFIWMNFSEGKVEDAPKGFYNMGLYLNVVDFIARADYLVQLSDHEAYSYSILESLTHKTPVICTPFPSAYEQGVEDGKNGYIVPFDMRFDVKKLLNIPSFDYEYDNESIKKQWMKLLGKRTTKSHDLGDSRFVKVKTLYYDIDLNMTLNPGTILKMKNDRIKEVLKHGFIEIVEG